MLWLLILPAQCLLISLNIYEVVMVTHSNTLAQRERLAQLSLPPPPAPHHHHLLNDGTVCSLLYCHRANSLMLKCDICLILPLYTSLSSLALYPTSPLRSSHLLTLISQHISTPPPPLSIAPSKSRGYKYLPACRRLIRRGISN